MICPACEEEVDDVCADCGACWVCCNCDEEEEDDAELSI
jgi:hypothetical protein